MGFNLGKALGGIAGSVVSHVTGGLVHPKINFNGPSLQRPSIISTVPDSTVTRTGAVWGLAGSTSTSYFTQPGQQKRLNSGAGTGMQLAACPQGFRLNKSTYITRGGGTSRWPTSLQVHPKGTECVRRRKMNPGNGRAATHAVRRLVAFYRLSNRVAKQLRKAATKAHLHGARHGKQLSRGRAVEVVNVDNS